MLDMQRTGEYKTILMLYESLLNAKIFPNAIFHLHVEKARKMGKFAMKNRGKILQSVE